MIYLDTHVVAWLFAGETTLLGDAAREALERDDDLRISPMVVLELEHLRETERIKPKAQEIITYLSREIGLSVCEQSFTRVIQQALDETWTRDPFDRIIVAQARLRDAPLITADRNMKGHYASCIW